MNNIFISTTFLKDNSLLKEALNQCNKYEIKGVEIGSNHSYEEDFNYEVSQVRLK